MRVRIITLSEKIKYINALPHSEIKIGNPNMNNTNITIIEAATLFIRANLLHFGWNLSYALLSKC
jgi:hypothetical protein